ncbi:MAG: sensory rhodopsin transducer [Anaerolineae bacterium]|nr:sensory rhodopsin transducer [Anaerolineae bacterium]
MLYTEWYYADGMIVDRLGRMIGDHWESGDWICLVNPGPQEAHITLTVFYEELPPREHSLTLGARRAMNRALHAIPGLLEHNLLYGVRVRADVPILAQDTRGEYEPDDPVTNAMGSTILTPGPLTEKDRELWYVDGIILTGGVLEESEWLSVLNPNPVEARIELTIFRGDREPGSYGFCVPAERVRTVKMDDLPMVPKNHLFSVRVESSVPVAAQEVRRAYERGHYSCARSMFTVMCIPAHP